MPLLARRYRQLRTGLRYARLAALYAVYGFLKHLVPVSRLVRPSAGQPSVEPDPVAIRRRIGEVLRISRLFGASGGDCLQRSLLMFRELRDAGAQPLLVFGFRKEDDGRLRGHAWVLCGGAVSGDEPSELERFQIAWTLPADKAISTSPRSTPAA
jgi:hypothetical protein